MLIAALALALETATPPPCDDYAAMTNVVPSLIPASLSERYHNGVSLHVTADVDANGLARNVRTDASPALAPVVNAWLSHATYTAARTKCSAVPGSLDTTADFYPIASGWTGLSHLWHRVDFDNFSYSDGPSDCKRVTLKNGEWSARDGSSSSANIDGVFAGTLARTPVALVVLRCEHNGHGYDAVARMFALRGGRVEPIGDVGTGGVFGPDTPSPPWPGGWLHVVFANGAFYADVWDEAHACDPKRDWTVTTYTIRDGRLAATDTSRHHRAGLPIACDR